MTVPGVQIRNLVDCEFLEGDRRADVERRLVEIRDEEMGLSCVSDRHGQAFPSSHPVEGPCIVPGSKEGKDLVAESAGEKAVHLVKRPIRAASRMLRGFVL